MDKLRQTTTNEFDYQQELLRAARDNKLSKAATAHLVEALEPSTS